MWSQMLMEPLRGKTPLWKVIWLYGFGVSLAYTVLGWIFVPETPLALSLFTLVGLALSVVQSVMLWKCAYNTRFRFTGSLLRLAVVVGVLMIPLFTYIYFSHPEIFAPLSNFE